MTDDLYAALRIIQLALLLLTLVVLGARVAHWWCHEWRCLLPAAGTGLIAVLIFLGTGIALLRDIPGDVRTLALTAASLALLMQACTVGMGKAHQPRGMYVSPSRSQNRGPAC